MAVAYLDFSEPSVGAALTELAADGWRDVVVVPLLFAPGYHLRVDLPAAVAEVRAGLPWLSVSIAEPLAVAAAPGRAGPAASTRSRPGSPLSGDGYDGVVLASAGSSDPSARAAVQDVAQRWERRTGLPVVPAYATAAGPRVAEAVELLRAQGAQRVAVSWAVHRAGPAARGNASYGAGRRCERSSPSRWARTARLVALLARRASLTAAVPS